MSNLDCPLCLSPVEEQDPDGLCVACRFLLDIGLCPACGEPDCECWRRELNLKDLLIESILDAQEHGDGTHLDWMTEHV